MREVLLVARREVRERLRARSFRIATVISAGAVVAAIAIPASHRGHTPTYDIGIVDAPTATTTSAIQSLAPSLGVRLRVRPAGLSDGHQMLRDGQLDVLVVGSDEILLKRAPEIGDTGKKAQLIAAMSVTLRLERVLANGGPEAVAQLRALEAPVPVHGIVRDTADPRARVTAFFGAMLLFVFLQQYGTWVLIGVVEEKVSRVVEVLLSAIRPRQLVAGKVIGIGAVAVLQAGAVAAAAYITALATNTNAFVGTSRYLVAWALVWFVLGYAFYSWAYAAIGSLVSRQADAQNAAFPLSVPIIVAYISATTLLSGGEPTPFIRVLSFLPPTAPMIMPMLIGLGKASAASIAISIALIVAGIALLARAAGAVYARAVLHTGQRLRLRQVLRRDFSAA